MSGKVDRHNVTIWRSENSHFYQENSRNVEDIRRPYLATNYWAALSFLPNQRIHFCGHVGKLCHSTVIQFTTKHYVPTRWRSPHCRHIVCDCLDEDFSNTYTLATEVTRQYYPWVFFVWGFAKDQVYANKVNGIEEMKRTIREAFYEIRVPVLKRFWADVEHRFD